MSETASPHISVLLNEVLDVLGDITGKIVVDMTFGAGGYSRALLGRGANVVAFDRDARVLSYAEAMKAEFGERFSFVSRPFSEVAEGLADLGLLTVDAIVMDIGVSSMQLDEAERGFSFQKDGPLDMRMSADGPTAADIINKASAHEIARILYEYGEEHRSRHIANVIVSRRKDAPFLRTLDLADCIEKALGGRRGAPTHPATKSFQGLRIAVNDELGELEAAMAASLRLLGDDGILAVVTFHSLEDRLVKRFMNTHCGRLPSASRHVPQAKSVQEAEFLALTPKSIAPSPEESRTNPRARSARLRAMQRAAKRTSR